MLQNWIVGVIVALAALYSIWYVLPLVLRQRLGRVHKALGPAAKSCSTCNSCGGCAAGAPGQAEQTNQPTEHVIKFHRATD